MECLKQSELKSNMLPGRIVQEAVGKNGPAFTAAMRVCICEYCARAGKMQPHRHIEESVFVTECDRAWVRYGSTEACADGKVMLEEGMVMHFPDWEWHVFEYEEGGMLKLVCFYASTEDRTPPGE